MLDVNPLVSPEPAPRAIPPRAVIRVPRDHGLFRGWGVTL